MENVIKQKELTLGQLHERIKWLENEAAKTEPHKLSRCKEEVKSLKMNVEVMEETIRKKDEELPVVQRRCSIAELDREKLINNVHMRNFTTSQSSTPSSIQQLSRCIPNNIPAGMQRYTTFIQRWFKVEITLDEK